MKATPWNTAIFGVVDHVIEAHVLAAGLAFLALMAHEVSFEGNLRDCFD
jgi:hypothetical protein